MEVGDSQGMRFEQLEALVDTGATYTVVPSVLLQRLEVKPLRRSPFILADGRRVEKAVGQTWVRVNGQAAVRLVVFGDEGEEPLIGADTLEGLLLMADPVGRRLLPTSGLLMEMRRGEVGPNKGSLRRLVRRHVPALVPYAGVDPPEVLAERAGIRPEQVIKLDANENAYGPSPRVAEAMAGFPWASIYPDPEQRQVRRALAGYAGTDAARVVAGAGADELIDLLVSIFMEPGEEMIDLTPTFGMYPVVARIHGARVVDVPRDEGFEVDVAAVRRALTPRTKLLFVANPNNPTGTLSSEACIGELLDLGVAVVVDETYHEFCGFTMAPLVPHHENLIVLRTLSKWAGLAGLRLGYGIMAPWLVERLLAVKLPYNVSTAAEAALRASLEDTDLLLHRVRLLVQERERMAGLLRRLPGVSCYPSKGNFLLCRFPPGQAGRVQAALARRGIFVRHFTHPRLQDCLRITAGKPEHTDALIIALQEGLKELT
jgi:histidinol-phosphate aminotransferase